MKSGEHTVKTTVKKKTRRTTKKAARRKTPAPLLFPDLAGREAAPSAKKTRTPRPKKPEATTAPNLFPPTPDTPAGSPAPETDAPGQRSQRRQRVFVGAALLAVWGALIVGRLVQTQVLEHEVMTARANGQHRHELTIPPLRGGIYDRGGRPLALTLAVDSVYVVPPDYADLDVSRAATTLARCLDVPRELVAARLRRDSRFSWLKRKAQPAEVECAKETGFPVGTIEENGRFYPGGGLAAQLVGYVGVDGDGLGGVEHAFDELIRGEPGIRTVWTDGRRTGRRSRIVRDSAPGADVSLTLDSHVQAVVEDELARGIEEFEASSGAAILIETATGEVLAMASAPSFDPNRVSDSPRAALVNRNITQLYEPGSVFKIFTAAAALEEGVTHENEPFATESGRVQVGRRTIHDWKRLGPLNFAGVIRMSSNTGTVEVASRLGSETFGRYIRAFGFGDATALPLGGEAPGIVPAGERWRPIRLATVSFGQGIAVTPVQMVRGVNTIANDGVQVPLRLVRSVGNETKPFANGNRVVSSRTALRVRRLLSGVVADGTGQGAAVRGFDIAGKTGTAQKPVPGGYSPNEFISSFGGFAPAEEPLFTAVVILHTERPHHSGSNAARVFGRIAERVLRRYRRIGSEVERVVVAASSPADAERFAYRQPRSDIGQPRSDLGQPRTVPVSFRPESESVFGVPQLSRRDLMAMTIRGELPPASWPVIEIADASIADAWNNEVTSGATNTRRSLAATATPIPVAAPRVVGAALRESETSSSSQDHPAREQER